MEETLLLSGSLLECSSSNGDLEAKFLICPLNQLNGNGVGLKQADLSEEELKGLQGKAVVTKVVKDSQGQYDFSGHNLKKYKEVTSEGKVIEKWDFDTNAVGYHTEVSVEDIMYGNEVVPCIVAKATIWERYEKVIEVITRLGASLRTSWEIAYDEAYYDTHGGKWIKGLKWLGNCLLGSKVRPAYKNAGLMEFAENDQEVQLALAFNEDFNEINRNLGQSNSNNKNLQGGMNMAGNGKEIASLAVEDLRDKVRRAVYATEGDGRYYYGVLVYPYDYVAYAKLESKDSTIEDYVKFNFTINSDSTVSVSGQEDVKMVFMPKETHDTEVANLKNDVAAKETELSTKLDEIIKLGEVIKTKETEISAKETEIAELQPYKEKAEEEARIAKEAEIAQQKEDLKQVVISSKYFTEEEIETSEELQKAIEELDEKSVKAMIGARVLEKASKIETSSQNDDKNIAKVAVSTLINHEYDKEENAVLKFLKK